MPVDEDANRQLQTLRALMDGLTSASDERKILEILRDATPEDLNFLLSRVDLNALFADLDDRIIGPDHLTDTLRLLCVDRRDDLLPDVQARIVFAMQSGPTWTVRERFMRDLFLGHGGQALTAFKNLLNGHGTHHDLEKLVFDDIDDDGIRNEILDHFEREAATAPSGELKILSDIDDTLYARLKDDRYPSGTIYPGVLALYDELDVGPGPVPGEAGDLTFVTARPTDVLGLIENRTRDMLVRSGLDMHSVLTGSFLNLTSHSSMAEKKLGNFRRYLRLFPEYGFVFIGDSGQGDVMFGQQMLEAGRDAVKGVFIHDVVSTPASKRAHWREAGIVFFDTYAGAAAEAYRAGLISRDGLKRVMRATTDELAAVAFDSGTQQEARFADLERDIALAEDMLATPGANTGAS
jgi:hypothetical protein